MPCPSILSRFQQWRNVTIWCPPAHFLPPPQIFYYLQKKKKKKKRSPLFFGFSYGLLAPLELFVPPNIFSRRPNAKLAEIWYILLLCQKIFRLKNVSLVICRPPKVLPPCIAGVAGAVVTPLVFSGCDSTPYFFNYTKNQLYAIWMSCPIHEEVSWVFQLLSWLPNSFCIDTCTVYTNT